MSYRKQNSSKTRAKQKLARGFTLIEVIVAIGIFSIVAFVALTSVLSITTASLHSQKARSLSDSLSFIFEDMVRNIQISNYALVSDQDGDIFSVNYLDQEGHRIIAVFSPTIEDKDSVFVEYRLDRNTGVLHRTNYADGEFVSTTLNDPEELFIDSVVFKRLDIVSVGESRRVSIHIQAHFPNENNQEITLQTTIFNRPSLEIDNT